MVEQVAEALVGLLDRAEAGELAHRPEAAAVHRRVDPARVGEGAGEALVPLAVVVSEIVGGVEGFDRVSGERLEANVALALVRVLLLEPLMGSAFGSGLDRHAPEGYP